MLSVVSGKTFDAVFLGFIFVQLRSIDADKPVGYEKLLQILKAGIQTLSTAGSL